MVEALPPSAGSSDSAFTGRGAAIVILSFLLALAGSLPLLSRYHFDEGWYTNAAIEMVRTGDLLTPKYADGTARFRKPVLTYWVLATSYAALGISLFSSRLPFLLAAACTLWITYRMAWAATQDRSTGILAAAILASNVQFMESATKSTPDILQCLFITISLWGAVELLLNGRRESRWYACLYLGAGLGIATKGLLPVLLIGFVWGFSRWFPSPASPSAGLMHRGWLLTGAALAFSGFLGMLLIRGPEALSTMFEDQIGERLEGAHTFVLTNLLLYVLTPVRFLAPWLLILAALIVARRAAMVPYYRSHRRLIWFVLGWLALNIVVFSLGNLMRTRYLLPAYPLLALLLAHVMQHLLRSDALNALASRITRWLFLAGIGVGIVVALTGTRLDARVAVGGILVAVLLTILYVLAFRRRTIPIMIALSLGIMASFASLEQFLKPVIITSPAADITGRLLQLSPLSESIAAVGLRPSVVNQIRLLSGGKIVLKEIREEAGQEALYRFQLILGSRRIQQAFAGSSGYVSEECGVAHPPLDMADLWTIVTTGDRERVLEKDRKPYYLIRKQVASAQS
jgi:4-amino-4-deoxy-L-arabinose transferase-like glycosyltransferase